MGIHPETTALAPGAVSHPRRRAPTIPLRPWLLLAGAAIALAASVLVTSTAAAWPVSQDAGGETPAAALLAIPEPSAALPVVLGLLGLAAMGRRPRELANARPR